MILNLNSTWSELKRKRVLFSEEVLPVIDRKHRRSQQTINKRRQTATNGRTLQLISVNDVETSVWMQQKQLDRSFERNQQRHERHQNEKREREKALARKLWIRLQMISSLQIVGQSVAFSFQPSRTGFPTDFYVLPLVQNTKAFRLSLFFAIEYKPEPLLAIEYQSVTTTTVCCRQCRV